MLDTGVGRSVRVRAVSPFGEETDASVTPMRRGPCFCKRKRTNEMLR